MRTFLGIALFGLVPASVFAQSTGAPPASVPAAASNPTFIAADAHPSPHRRFGGMMGPILRGDRYLLRQATMRDMVAIAYNVVAGFVSGGPVWLEREKFDIYAKMPPDTTQDQARLMLRALLVERFNLMARESTESAPARVLIVSKDGVKMKQATGSEEDAGCRFKPQPPPPPDQAQNAAPQYMTISCRNVSLAAFVLALHNFTYDYW